MKKRIDTTTEQLWIFTMIAVGAYVLLRMRKGKGEGVQLRVEENEVVYMGQTQDVETAINPIRNCLIRIFHYEADTATWSSWINPLFYPAGVPTPSLTTIVHGDVYWAFVAEDCFWSW